MKKFLFLIVASVLAGMLGAYVTTASAGNMLDLILNGIVWPSTAYAGDVCPQWDPSCCKPTQWWVSCDPNGQNRLLNSCGSTIGACSAGTVCAGPNGQASCQTAMACDPNGALVGCNDKNTATNGCGKTQACQPWYECRVRWWCQPTDSSVYWFCNNKSDIDNVFYGRYNTQGVNQICPWWCNSDANGDGNLIDAVCKPGSCPFNSKDHRRCDISGNIVNGCGEVVEDCAWQWLRCDGNQSSCKCIGDGDVCNNIAGIQSTVPAWYTRDANGNCNLNPNGKPVWECVSIGNRQKTAARREWANYDKYRMYSVGDQASLNEWEIPSWTTCGYAATTDMIVSKRWDKKTIQSGDQVTYTITVTNWWAGVVTYSRLDDAIPVGMRFVSSSRWHAVYDTRVNKYAFVSDATINGNWRRMANFTWATNPSDFWWKWDGEVGWWYPWQTVYLPTDRLTWYWGNGELLPGVSQSVQLVLEYDGSLPDGTCIDNTAIWGMDTPDTSPNNNQSTYTVCVWLNQNADVSITKSVDRVTFPNQKGEIVTWKLDYQNNGSQLAKDVAIVDTLPSWLEFVWEFTPKNQIAYISLGTGNTVKYVLNGDLLPGATGSILVKSRYVGGKPDNVALTNIARIYTTTLETNYNNNAGAVATPTSQPIVSCDAISVTVTNITTSTGVRVDYGCTTTNSSSVQFKILSWSTAIITVTGAAGSIYVPFGTYTAQCVVNGSITHKVVTYVPAINIACAYRQHKTIINDRCAVKNNLPPLTGVVLDLDNIINIPSPVAYCTPSQESDDVNYQCLDANAGSKILTKDPNACTKSIVTSPVWSLGDRVWHDANKNGIQDAGELGIAGTKVSLYTCGGALVTSGTTDVNGNYLFDSLVSWSYKIKFGASAGYGTFTLINAVGSTTGNDSNANSAWDTACITLVGGENNLTIDAGVYKGPTFGWNNLCGNGKLEPSWIDTIVGTADDEECDDGNVVSGDRCSRTCKIESSCSRCGWGSGNTTKKITKNETGWYIDPPDVMVGEYLPYRWNFDKASDIEFTDDCNIWVHNPSVTYVVNSRDNKGAICEFYLVDGKGTKSKTINHYCDERRNLTDWKLFTTYFEWVSPSILRNYNGSSGASFISPLNWITTLWWEFTYLGEYNLVWNKTTYYTCDAQFEVIWKDANNNATKDPWEETTEFDKYVLSNEWISDMDIKMPFTVTKPYMTQQNWLSASAQDADIMSKIVRINGHRILETNPTSTTQTLYKWSSNLGYLVDAFVKKYAELAKPLGMNTSVPGLLVWSIMKISNADIYVVGGNDSKIIDSAGTLWKKTIIVPNGDITIVGDIKNNILFIVPNGNIILKPDFYSDSYSSPRNQSLKGIYIAQKVISDQYWNNELMKSWVFGWQLKIDGLIVNLAADANAIKDLTNARRSTLKDWFDSSVSRIKLVQEGSSLQIATSPSLWTSLPPGANELMKELQAFK